MSKTPQNSAPKKRKWEDAFIAALEKTGNVSTSAKAARVDRSMIYQYRKQNEDFAGRWEVALQIGADSLEAEAVKRAMAGSDKLLMFLLKGLKPDRYREKRFIQGERSGLRGTSVAVGILEQLLQDDEYREYLRLEESKKMATLDIVSE